MRYFVCETDAVEWKTVHQLQVDEDIFQLTEQLQRRCSNSSLHFWSDFVIIKVKQRRRSQVATGLVQRTEHFPASLVMVCIYELYLRCDVNLNNSIIKNPANLQQKEF